ncbi:hypothetical protein CesoFtcFv8_015900 [Champsocephalus esox]|uniref:Uncharacterized protein n=1 Tax=Champsocephalus esox TaxID=159716 RepID=A0AAN8BL31_9TELE|nr:hypothetical protein CesoFtcFv8_015900 [Champsocephalus esox]
MCRDNAALGEGITSRVIRSERAERGADVSHQSAGRRRADSDDEAWDAERDPGDGRRQRLSQEAAVFPTSKYVSAGEETTTAECGSLALAFTALSLQPLFGARAFEYCMLYCFQGPCTMHRGGK